MFGFEDFKKIIKNAINFGWRNKHFFSIGSVFVGQLMHAWQAAKGEFTFLLPNANATTDAEAMFNETFGPHLCLPDGRQTPSCQTFGDPAYRTDIVAMTREVVGAMRPTAIVTGTSSLPVVKGSGTIDIAFWSMALDALCLIVNMGPYLIYIIRHKTTTSCSCITTTVLPIKETGPKDDRVWHIAPEKFLMVGESLRQFVSIACYFANKLLPLSYTQQGQQNILTLEAIHPSDDMGKCDYKFSAEILKFLGIDDWRDFFSRSGCAAASLKLFCLWNAKNTGAQAEIGSKIFWIFVLIEAGGALGLWALKAIQNKCLGTALCAADDDSDNLFQQKDVGFGKRICEFFKCRDAYVPEAVPAAAAAVHHAGADENKVPLLGDHQVPVIVADGQQQQQQPHEHRSVQPKFCVML